MANKMADFNPTVSLGMYVGYADISVHSKMNTGSNTWMFAPHLLDSLLHTFLTVGIFLPDSH